MTRETLERYQVLVYMAAIVAGLSAGTLFPAIGGAMEAAIWPVLGLLLYVTFTQVPLGNLHQAIADYRFLYAAIIGNFLVIPVIVWGMVLALPDIPALRIGVAMVLLVPCTDWFITFTQLGRGITQHAIAFAPVSLLLQIVFLPLWFFIIFGGEQTISLATSNLLIAFAGIILLPLFLARLTEKWASAAADRQQMISKIGSLPVPLLAIVIFMIAVSQSGVITDATSMLWYPFLIFAGFLIIAAGLSKIISRLFRLSAGQGRVLAFSYGSRNSFVVLPIALALPGSLELAAIVIVLQSLVELFGMAIYIWFVPGKLFP